MFAPSDLFDLSQSGHAALFEGCQYAWEVLARLRDYLHVHARPERHPRRLGQGWLGDQVCIGEGTVVEVGACIRGPAIIGRDCQIRHNAFIREYVIVGDGCVVGNACELKNAVLFNGCQVPHFNYVGDSILGYRAHLGAGAILSNVKLVKGNVSVEWDGQRFDSGLRKFGALVGDHAEIGCNAVLNPGSIIGRGSIVYPGVVWRGTLPANRIVKPRAAQVVMVRRPRAS